MSISARVKFLGDIREKRAATSICIMASALSRIDTKICRALIGFNFKEKLSSFLPLEYALACPAGQKIDPFPLKLNRNNITRDDTIKKAGQPLETIFFGLILFIDT